MMRSDTPINWFRVNKVIELQIYALALTRNWKNLIINFKTLLQ